MQMTKAEEEILRLIKEEYLTIKQIALRRGTSYQAVHKIVRSLRKKGLLKLVVQFRNDVDVPPNALNQIRLHGQEFNIKILWAGEKYHRLYKEKNIMRIDNNLLRLYKNSLEIYSGQFFYGIDAHSATSKSMAYWNRFLNRLENDLGIIIIKPRNANIKIVKQHYAEVNNELSEEAEEKGYKIKVMTTDDRKLWFQIDNSLNMHEAETLHKETAKHDMQDIVAPFFNDLRDNEPVTMMDLKKLVFLQCKENLETARGLGIIVKLMGGVPKDTKQPEGEPADYFG